MSQLTEVRETFAQWIDLIANTINAQFVRLGPQRHVRLIEDENGFFLHAEKDAKGQPIADHRIEIVDGAITSTLPDKWTELLRGSRAEIELRSSRLLFRPLELPKRAAEFLDAIIRSQIDRLTPWTVAESIFGWTTPESLAGERIKLTIAATSKALVTPYLNALSDFGVRTAIVSTTMPNGAHPIARIALYEQRTDAALNARRIKSALAIVLLITCVGAVAATGLSTVLGEQLTAEQQEITQKILKRRAQFRAGRDADMPARMLEGRKREVPASVIVLEEVSRVLPDHTYVTELRIEGDKLQLVGVTQDAPSLIKLIEQSPHFTRATFFAPTTRATNDPGERFHIEARIKPYFPAGT